MTSARRRLGLAGVLLFAALVGRAEDAPRGGDSKMPREPDKAATEDTKPTVTLTQKEYQELLDKIARLEGSAKAEAPSTCKISGQVNGDLAQLTVEFEFRTGTRRTRVALGCNQGYPTEARIDGHPPHLRWGPEGHSVQVDEAGDHQLILKMDLPLAARERGAERGLDLDLPAAAATTLDLALPSGVKRVLLRTSVRGETVPGKPPAAQEHRTEAPANGPSRLKTSGLGPVERLELTWESQAPAAGPPLLAVTGSRVTVRVDDQRGVATHADITLAVRRGELKELQLLVPPQAVISRPPDDDRVTHIDPPGKAVRAVRLKPTTDPLTLAVDVPHQRSDGRLAVGPFVVLGAVPQRGDIVVTVPADMTLDYHARGESQYLLLQREPTEDEKKAGNVLALQFSTLPGLDKAQPQPFMELEVGRLTGAVAARVSHALRLVREEGRPAAWRLTTTIEAQAFHTDADHLDVELPPDYAFDENAVPPGDAQAQPLPGRQIRFLLTRKVKGKFQLTFEGQYSPDALKATDTGQMTVALPLLLGKKYDKGAVVSVTLPQDLEVVPPRAGPPWESGKPDARNNRTWTSTVDRWPERVEVAWRPYRPDLIVNGEVRVTLQGRQASVTHRLWLGPPAGQAAPEQLALNVPREVIGFTVVGEAEGTPRREGKDGARLVALAPPADRDHALVLKYSFRLPERPADPVKVPLVWPRAATGGETRVFVWSDPGTRPEWKGGNWQARRTEEVKDESSYPSLVLLSDRPGEPLTLGLGEAAGVALAAFRVEKALIQATVGEAGEQHYRARFRLGQVAAPTIDVELPAALFRSVQPEVTVLLTGKTAVWRPVDDAGKETAVSRIARVQVPADAVGKSLALEVNYTLLPGRSLLQTQLQAPQLRGDPGAAPVRWQVVLPPSWVPLSQDVLGADYGWGRRGWLYALRPTVSSAEFERWFAEPDSVPLDAGKYPDPTVAVVRSSAEPLRLSHVPEQAWLMVCSLTLLIVGLALAFLSLPRAVFWGTLSALGVGALLAGLFWPGVLGAVLYGCQPGALVLLPVLGFQWLLHQRYRRQVVFLPGFTRLKTGSSLTRGGRPRGEPSTVDATPSAGAEPSSKKSQADGSAGK
jgi:hypothetical protein